MFSKEHSAERLFAVWWNNTFPIDLWYRKKHGLRFNSDEHRSISFLDMIVEWEEENAFIAYENSKFDDKEHDEYEKTGHWLREREDSKEMTQEELNNFLGDDDSWSKLDDSL